jgi:DNA polymerase III subunit beta
MKFSCGRDILLKNLHLAQRATDAKNRTPVLRNVLFELSGNRLSMIGYDHRIGIKADMECVGEEDGRITVPCPLVIEVLSVMMEKTVYFSLEDTVLHMECGRSRYNFNCIPAEDFPPFPKSEGKDVFDMDKKMLDIGIRQTIFATNPDDARVFMGGVLMKTEKDSKIVRFVSTDGHRLAMRVFVVEGQQLPESQVIIPTRTLSELLRVLTDSEQKAVKISVDSKSVSFSTDGVYIVSRLIETEYPKFERVIPDHSEGSCRVNRLRLLSAARGASIMACSKENRDIIEINITDESIRFASTTKDVGSANEEVEITKKGKDVRIAFNSKYIIDFLNSVDDEEIVIDYKDELDPGHFHTDMPDYTYVLMPVKV